MASIIDVDSELGSSTCSECGGNLIFTDHERELVCSECGLIIIEYRIWPYGHGIIFRESKDIFSSPFAKYGRKDDLSFLKTPNHAFLNTHACNDPKLHKERRIFDMLSGFKEELHIQYCQREQINYQYLKIYQKYSVINSVSLLATLIYKFNKENHIDIGLNRIIGTFRLYGYRVNNKLIIRDILRYDLQKNIFAQHNSRDIKETYFNRFFDLVFESQEFLNRLNKKEIDISHIKKETKRVGKLFLNKINNSVNPRNLSATSIYGAIIVYGKTYKKGWLLTQSLISKILDIHEYSVRDLFVTYLKPLLQSQFFILLQPGESIRSPFFSNQRITIKGTD